MTSATRATIVAFGALGPSSSVSAGVDRSVVARAAGPVAATPGALGASATSAGARKKQLVLPV